MEDFNSFPAIPLFVFSSADRQKKGCRMSTVGIVQKVPYVDRPPSSTTIDDGGRCSQGLMGSRGCHGSTIDLRRWHMVEEGVLHDGPLLNGRKRPGTYSFPRSFAAAAAAAIASLSISEVDGDGMAFNSRRRP